MGNRKNKDSIPESVNFDNILDEIERLRESRPDGFSIKEFRKETGRSDAWCKEMVRNLIETGKVKYNGKRKSLTIDQRVCYTPIYKVL